LEPETKPVSNSMHKVLRSLKEVEKEAQSKIAEAQKRADDTIAEAQGKAEAVRQEAYRDAIAKVREEVPRLLDQAKLEAKQEVEGILSRAKEGEGSMMAKAQGHFQKAVEAAVEEVLAAVRE